MELRITIKYNCRFQNLIKKWETKRKSPVGYTLYTHKYLLIYIHPEIHANIYTYIKSRVHTHRHPPHTHFIRWEFFCKTES